MRILLLSLLIALTAQHPAARNPIPPYADREAAEQWCATAPLLLIEGLWIFPDDGLKVVIMRENDSEIPTYAIRAVGGSSLSFAAGETIGRIFPTTSPQQFKISMRPSGRKLLKRWVDFAGTLVDDGYGLSVSTTQTKYRFNPIGLLPGFWRIVRSSTSDPMTKLPIGLIKLCPSYDGNGTQRNEIIYL